MPGDGWPERYCRFLLRRRWLAVLVAAIHAGVTHGYWSLFGALISLGSLRAAGLLSLAVILSQAVMLVVLWSANIDLNMHTLPVVLAAMGTVVLPASLASLSWPQEEEWAGLGYALIALATVSVGAALVWLFSPLRLQTEMGLYVLVFAVVNALIPLQLQSLGRLVESVSAQTSDQIS